MWDEQRCGERREFLFFSLSATSFWHSLAGTNAGRGLITDVIYATNSSFRLLIPWFLFTFGPCFGQVQVPYWDFCSYTSLFLAISYSTNVPCMQKHAKYKADTDIGLDVILAYTRRPRLARKRITNAVQGQKCVAIRRGIRG
jgi:hypothetical protein